jgi:hypothetical protein
MVGARKDGRRAFSPSEERFPALSLRDVLEARDAYHVHLLSQPNVVATAVGRYLIRVEEAPKGPFTLEERLRLPPGERPPRTLERSRVEEWSWPCVLVFVDRWMTAAEIADNPDEMVPRRLYLPDGKIVPTCVIYAPPAKTAQAPEQHLSFPSRLLGGGYVCLADIQGAERAGSIACLVSDGSKTYALTNRHVAGEEGRRLATMVDGERVEFGSTAAVSVGRLRFMDVYPGFPGERMEVALDAALVEVDDVRAWTTQVFGVGTLTDIYDVSPESLTLDLVGTEVRAFGAASGELEGELLALYYRYRTRSGIEYVADALIGPRGPEPLRTQPGDSGTLWTLEPADRRRRPRIVSPIALQWGGHRFLVDGASRASPYALVTFLSNVCRALDVEVVYDWNTGHDLYWGAVGHYSIGSKACDLVSGVRLRRFFVANRTNISFSREDIESGKYKLPNGTLFYPLADLPDYVWKSRSARRRPHEGPNHFADLDQPDPAGATLLSLFRDDAGTVDPTTWIDFYRRLDKPDKDMGLLPFRVAQLYKTVVDSLTSGTPDGLARALCAAGVMAHYVGDACQPLHTSHHHDGRTPEHEGVHGDYETKMMTSKRREVVAGLERRLARATPRDRISGHRNAAVEVVELMDRSVRRLPPDRIIDVWAQTGGRSDDLWLALGRKTLDCLADGIRTLAMLWSSAWKEADARAPRAEALDQDQLLAICVDPAFAPSLYLPELRDTRFW